MEERPNDILTLLRQEPEQTGTILKFGLVAPVLIMLCHVIGTMLGPAYAIAPATAVLIFIYGIVLAFLSGRMVHTADRWQADSAMQARRAIAEKSRSAADPVVFHEPVPLAQAVMQSLAPPPAEPPPPPTHFQQAYFRLRLHDEVMRSRREGQPLSLIVMQVALPGEPDESSLERLAVEVATLASNHAKTIGLCLQVDDTEFAFALPNSDRKAAKDFLAKVVQAMGDYWCNCGLAVYPENGGDAQALLEYARSQESQGRNEGRG